MTLPEHEMNRQEPAIDGVQDWYFDFISPFAYLQWMRLQREAPQVRLRPRPVLLAGLLEHWGQLGPAEIPAKRRHTYRMVLWQARQSRIPLCFPPAHPFNSLNALRLALAADDTIRAVDLLFRHIWEHGRAADDLAVLEPVAHELGVRDLAAALADPQVKGSLKDNGRDAIALGVFGVPTLVLGGQLFWGDDATGMALQYLDSPAMFDEPQMRALDALPIAAQRAQART